MSAEHGRRELSADLRAAIEARQELGSEYDPALVEAFVERVEAQLQQRLETADKATEERRWREAGDRATAGNRQLVLGLVSLGTGIPITAIAGSIADLPGLVVVWAGIGIVNWAHAWQSHRRH